MDRAGLLRLARVRFDDRAQPYLFEDETLTGYLNDAVKQACLRKRALFERANPKVCRYAITTGTADLRLHPAVLAVRTARLAGSASPLVLTTLKRIDRDEPDWPSRTGTPTHLILDAQSGRVTLFPAPAADATLEITCWRTPLESELLEGDADEPVIDELFHADLLDWVEHLAYLNIDAESQDLGRSDKAAARFEAKFGRLPSAHEIRLWAVSPRRGGRAEFL